MISDEHLVEERQGTMPQNQKKSLQFRVVSALSSSPDEQRRKMKHFEHLSDLLQSNLSNRTPHFSKSDPQIKDPLPGEHRPGGN